MSDLFHEPVPDGFIDRVLSVCRDTPRHTYQILTKRAERLMFICGISPTMWRRNCGAAWGGGCLLG